MIVTRMKLSVLVYCWLGRSPMATASSSSNQDKLDTLDASDFDKLFHLSRLRTDERLPANDLMMAAKTSNDDTMLDDLLADVVALGGSPLSLSMQVSPAPTPAFVEQGNDTPPPTSMATAATTTIYPTIGNHVATNAPTTRSSIPPPPPLTTGPLTTPAPTASATVMDSTFAPTVAATVISTTPAPTATTAVITPSPTTPGESGNPLYTMPPSFGAQGSTLGPTLSSTTTTPTTTIPPPPANTPECVSAFAYCRDSSLSQCFDVLAPGSIDSASTSTMSMPPSNGWSMDLSTVDFAQGPFVCDLVVGGTDCNPATATVVGSVSITDASVTYTLGTAVTSLSFDVYIGTCPLSDGGIGAMSQGACNPSYPNPYQVDKYPLSTGPSLTNSPVADSFTFDVATNQATYTQATLWGPTYETLPVSNHGLPVYLAAHAQVCSSGEPSTTTNAPTSSDSTTTNAPTTTATTMTTPAPTPSATMMTTTNTPTTTTVMTTPAPTSRPSLASVATPAPTPSVQATTSAPFDEPTPAVQQPPSSLTMPPFEWTFNPSTGSSVTTNPPSLDQDAPSPIDTGAPTFFTATTPAPTPNFTPQGATPEPTLDFVPSTPTMTMTTPPVSIPSATTVTTNMPSFDMMAPSTGTPAPTTAAPSFMSPVGTIATIAPTSNPGGTSTTTMPSLSQSIPTVAPPSSGCVYAFVYCGDSISVCFDSVSGIASPPAGSAMTPGSGWSINMTDYDFDANGPLTCQLLAGADACNVATASVVGSVDVTDSSIRFTTKPPSTSVGFHAYVGNCLMSDSGIGQNFGGGCTDSYTPYDVDKYPLSSGDLEPPVSDFVFDVNNQVQYTQAALWGPSYQSFTIANHGSPVYLSAHAEICFGDSTNLPTLAPVGVSTGAPTAPTIALPTTVTTFPPIATTTFEPTGPTSMPTPRFVEQGSPEPSQFPGTMSPSLGTVPVMTNPPTDPTSTATLAPTLSAASPTITTLPPIPSTGTTVMPTLMQTLPPIPSEGGETVAPTPATATLSPIPSTGTTALPTPTETLPPIPSVVGETVAPTPATTTLAPIASAESTIMPTPTETLPPIPSEVGETFAPTPATTTLAPIASAESTIMPTPTETLPPIPSEVGETFAPTPATVTLPPVSSTGTTALPTPSETLPPIPSDVSDSVAPTSTAPVTLSPIPSTGTTALPTTTKTLPPVLGSTPSPSILLAPSVSTSMPSLIQMIPTVPSSDVCVNTFVYCGEEISVCFDSVDGVLTDESMNMTGSGWSINLSGVSFDDGPLQCQLIAGAANCDVNAKGAFVAGTAEITDSAVTYFVKSEWSSSSFQTYVGSCLMSDGGIGISQSGQCSTVYTPYDVASYPLSSGPLDLPVTNFVFNSSNQDEYTTASWGTYQAFDMTSHGSPAYLSGHVEICSCHDMTDSPAGEVPSEPTTVPLTTPSSPITAPALVPSTSPFSMPIASSAPFVDKSPTPPPSPTTTTPGVPSALPGSTAPPSPDVFSTLKPSLTEQTTPTPSAVESPVTVTVAPTTLYGSPVTTLSPSVGSGITSSPSTPVESPVQLTVAPTPAIGSPVITLSPSLESEAAPPSVTGSVPTKSSAPTPTFSGPTTFSTVAPTPYFSEQASPKPTILPPSPTKGVPSPITEIPTTLSPTTDAPSSIQPIPSTSTISPSGIASPTVALLPSASSPTTTLSPSGQQSCVDSFVYCGLDMSTCFESIPGIEQPSSMGSLASSGWSINLTDYNFDENGPLLCQLIAGAKNCDVNWEGSYVAGTVEIAESSVTYQVTSGWGSTSFETYIGNCLASDAGAGVSMGGECTETYNPYDVSRYPLSTGSLGTQVADFTFDSSNQAQYTTNVWGSYESFDISLHSTPVYFSGHAEICHSDGMTESPISSPIGITLEPAPSPASITRSPSGLTQAPAPTVGGKRTSQPTVGLMPPSVSPSYAGASGEITMKPAFGTTSPTSFVEMPGNPSARPSHGGRPTPFPTTASQTSPPSHGNQMAMFTRAPFSNGGSSVPPTSMPTVAFGLPTGVDSLYPTTVTDATPTKRPSGAPVVAVGTLAPTPLQSEDAPSSFLTPTRSPKPFSEPSKGTSTPVPSPVGVTYTPTSLQRPSRGTQKPTISGTFPSPATGLHPGLGNCLDAFVYCGQGSSKCFSEFDGVDALPGASGWSIDLSLIDYENDKLECQILANVPNCDVEASSVIVLGYAEITTTSFTWFLRSEYASTSFQLYVGTCPMSDGGNAFTSGSTECTSPTPYDVLNYPLVAEGLREPKTKYSFGLKNQERKTSASWTQNDGTKYQIFDLSTMTESLYLSAHAEICECVDEVETPGSLSPALSPTTPILSPAPFAESGGSDSTEFPTTLPTVYPSKAPTLSPTSLPTTSPTLSPTKAPTLAPTTPPTAAPTMSPTTMPTTSPSEAVVVSPPSTMSATAVPTSSTACQDAYVWCPGRSTCFLDPKFNCYTQTKGRGVWGWNIEYASEDGILDDCIIVSGAAGCDVDSGIVIGNATITPEQFVISLESSVSSGSKMEYSFYAGECRGSDGGQSLDLSICLADTVAQKANSPDEFPLTSGKVLSSSYTFDGSLAPREVWEAHAYNVFPLGSETRQYLTGHVEICPV